MAGGARGRTALAYLAAGALQLLGGLAALAGGVLLAVGVRRLAGDAGVGVGEVAGGAVLVAVGVWTAWSLSNRVTRALIGLDVTISDAGVLLSDPSRPRRPRRSAGRRR